MSRANRRRPKGYNGAAEKPPLSAVTGPLAAKDPLERYAIEEPRHLVLEGLAADLGVRVVDAQLAGTSHAWRESETVDGFACLGV
jgi:hypothetical protein